MNIFALDNNPVYAALAQHDRHVVKMILESAQMLSTCVQHKDMQRYSFMVDDYGKGLLYKPTHSNHPCSVWVRESDANFVWLVVHMDALVAEYHRRFPNKTHACNKLKFMFACMAGRLIGRGFYTTEGIHPDLLDFANEHTPFATAMPLQYRDIESEVQSYRNYYVAEKVAGNRWTNPIYEPKWLIDAQPLFHYPQFSPVRTRSVPKPLPPEAFKPTIECQTERRGPLGLALLKKESR